MGEPTTFNGQWSVEFIDGGPELPTAYKTRELTSWTTAPDAKVQAFAGTVRLHAAFHAPQSTARGLSEFLWQDARKMGLSPSARPKATPTIGCSTWATSARVRGCD